MPHHERIVRLHVKPTLGQVKLKSLTPAHVRGLYRERLTSGLAPRMVQLVHTTLKQAVADGLIPRNVTEAVRAPQVTRKEITPLSAGERPRGSSRRRAGSASRHCTCWP